MKARFSTICAILMLSILLGPATPGLQPADRVVEVQSGESVEVFAKRYLKDPRKWRKVLAHNNLKPADFKPGLKLKIPAQFARKPDAIVLGYQSSARFSRASSESWNPVTRGLSIFRMDRIATDAKGFVNLLFQNAMRVQIKPGTRVIVNFNSVGGSGSSDLFLQQGRLRSFTTSPGKRTAFRITTPTAVASVRGTDFQTDVEKDGKTAIACHEGVVEVSAQGKTVKLREGYRTVVEPGKAPEAPKQLLPPPKPI